MTILSLIAAVDEASGIGSNNQLLCHLPADLIHFKKLTMGKPIIMGRKTFESIGRPLPGRKNIVISTQSMVIDGVTVVPSLQQAIDQIFGVEEAMIIGGSKVFEQTLPFAKRLYLTVIHHYFQADVYFPEFNKADWKLVFEEHRPRDQDNVYDMTFYQYDRK